MVTGISGVTVAPPVLTKKLVVVLEVVLWSSVLFLFSLWQMLLTLGIRRRFARLLVVASSFLDEILLACLGQMM